MAGAIGQVLGEAVGVALSPVAIIAVVLMLMTPNARVNGPAFVIGWIVGLGILGVVVLLIAGPSGASDHGTQSTGTNWLLVVIGVLVLRLAVREWRARPRAGEVPPLPKWMGAIDGFTPVKSLAAGIVLVAANPKNLLLVVSAGATIAATNIAGGQQAVAYAVFAVIGTIGVAIPVVIYFALGTRAPHLLESLRAWLAHNNSVIMSVLLLVIGAKILGQGIGGF
jgi:hypothetical protein